MFAANIISCIFRNDWEIINENNTALWNTEQNVLRIDTNDTNGVFQVMVVTSAFGAMLIIPTEFQKLYLKKELAGTPNTVDIWSVKSAPSV